MGSVRRPSPGVRRNGRGSADGGLLFESQPATDRIRSPTRPSPPPCEVNRGAPACDQVTVARNVCKAGGLSNANKLLTFAKLAGAGLLLGIVFATPGRGADVSEAELAEIALNAISPASTPRYISMTTLTGPRSTTPPATVEHTTGATPAERNCLWAKLHREGTSGPVRRERDGKLESNEAAAPTGYRGLPGRSRRPFPPQYLQFRVQPVDNYPEADRAAAGTLQTAGITLSWQARWADPANPDAASPPTLTPGRKR